MSNLLPHAIQDQIWADTCARFIATVAVMLIVSAGISMVTLIPAYAVLVVRTPVGSAHSNLSASSTPGTAADIALAQEIIRGFAPVIQATSSPETALAAMLAVKPEDVDLTHISYAYGKPSVMALVGDAETRDYLNEYRVALTQAHLGIVSVPVSALVGTQDGHFTMTISGTF